MTHLTELLAVLRLCPYYRTTSGVETADVAPRTNGVLAEGWQETAGLIAEIEEAMEAVKRGDK